MNKDSINKDSINRDGRKRDVIRYLDENMKIFTDVSSYIWENPELSMQEHLAAKMYTRVLRDNGFTVTENLGGMETAFMGSYGHGRPVIGFLGEFDALAGMSQDRACARKMPAQGSSESDPGHGCGHNMLGAGALAAAFALKHDLEKTGQEGTVIFFGCPGEEGCASKAFLARDGYWKQLDAALTWHPKDVNEVATGTNNSSIQVLYEFHGTAAHAAGDPYNGRSALDAVELMNIGTQFLREHMTADCRVHYAITDAGGISPNVVQAKAAVLYMVRANRVRDSIRLLERVDKIAQGAALMTETTLERKPIDGTAELVPNFTLEEALYGNFELLDHMGGFPAYTKEELALAGEIKKLSPSDDVPGTGTMFDPQVRQWVLEKTDNGKRALNDFLIPPVHAEGFVPGSTDVGDVSWQTPTAQIHTAAFISGAPGHSWQNVSTGGSSIGDKALLLAGKVLAMTAIDLLEDPQLLAKARAEFEERTAEGYVCPVTC